MKLIRKLIATWPAAAVLCAVIAVALAVTVSAAGSHRSQQTNISSTQPHAASVDSLAPEAATPSATCTAARQAVATALANEKNEDTTEKAASKKASPANADIARTTIIAARPGQNIFLPIMARPAAARLPFTKLNKHHHLNSESNKVNLAARP